VRTEGRSRGDGGCEVTAEVGFQTSVIPQEIHKNPATGLFPLPNIAPQQRGLFLR
jgi:hypothetical protein